VAERLAAIEPPIVSLGDWERCEQTWRVQLLPRFPYIETLTSASIKDFYRVRLREVARETVRKDRAVLLQKLRVPEHYRLGDLEIRITAGPCERPLPW